MDNQHIPYGGERKRSFNYQSEMTMFGFKLIKTQDYRCLVEENRYLRKQLVDENKAKHAALRKLAQMQTKNKASK